MTPQQRGDDEDYWGDDDGLGGWSKFMGEERSGKSDAIRKGRERARGVDDESVATLAERASSPASTTGEVKTAYKRGGPRPWEVARAAREAEASSNPGAGSRAGADADASDPSGSAFTRAGLPAHMVNAMRAAIPHMRKQRRGRIINTISRNAEMDIHRTSGYAAAKAAMWAASRVTASEVADDDILVNMLIPGPTRTPIWGRDMPQLQEPAVTYPTAKLLASLPAGGPTGKVFWNEAEYPMFQTQPES